MVKVPIRHAAALGLLLVLASLTPAAAHPFDGRPDTVAELREVLAGLDGGSLGSEHGQSAVRPPRARNLQLVGSSDLGGGGFNTDVWAHGQFAYVGTWGAFTPEGLFCPNLGTKVIDISRPETPTVVNVLPAPPGTQTNDAKTATVNTPFFRGDLLVVSNEDCMAPGARGFELWDVTDPLNTQFLGRYGPEAAFDVPEDLVEIGFGVHNTFIFERGRRVYVAAVVDFAEIFQFIFGGFDPSAVTVGDLHIVDVTDPTAPVRVGDWGTIKNLGLDPFAGQGAFSLNFIHDVTVEGDVAYTNWWDAGPILLDVSDPTDPQFLGGAPFAPTEDGDSHAIWPARGGNLFVTGDEDFAPGPWGFMRVFDSQDVTAPFEIGTFATPNALSDREDEIFSIHNVLVRGNTVYASWYSDGIRLVDISQPAAPREIGSFVPPAVADPFGIFPTAPIMWGVHPTGNLVLASDVNAGLYVLRAVPG